MYDVTSQPTGKQRPATLNEDLPAHRYIFVAVAGTITYTTTDDPDYVHAAVPFGHGWHPLKLRKVTAVETMAISDIKLCF
jgi:hypothetical protein